MILEILGWIESQSLQMPENRPMYGTQNHRHLKHGQLGRSVTLETCCGSR